MNKINILIILLLLCCACKNESSKQEQSTQDTTHAEIPQDIFTEPLIEGTYIADDYPITDDIVSDSIYSHALVSGNLKSFDQAWFINDSLDQVIVISLATDRYHMGISHFYTKDAVSLQGYLDLSLVSKTTNNIATTKEIEKDWGGFIKLAKKIGTQYFTSNKGIKPGDSLQKIISIYGLPDSTSNKNGVTRYQWTYNGIDPEFWDSTVPKHRPIVKESIGHRVIMLFKDKELLAQIIINEIP